MPRVYNKIHFVNSFINPLFAAINFISLLIQRKTLKGTGAMCCFDLLNSFWSVQKTKFWKIVNRNKHMVSGYTPYKFPHNLATHLLHFIVTYIILVWVPYPGWKFLIKLLSFYSCILLLTDLLLGPGVSTRVWGGDYSGVGFSTLMASYGLRKLARHLNSSK